MKAGSGMSFSVAMRPGAMPITPPATMNGRSLCFRTDPMASTTLRSVSAAACIWEKSWLYAEVDDAVTSFATTSIRPEGSSSDPR